MPLRQLLDAADGPEHERAWREFVDSYSRLILYVARRTPCDPDVVMDRYAFVLEQLREQRFRRLRTFAVDGRGKFTTWLTVVVRRLCVDHDRRKNGRVPGTGPRGLAAPRRLVELVFDPEVLDRLSDTRPSADEELDRDQVLWQLDAAIATLSPSDQLLLTLRYEAIARLVRSPRSCRCPRRSMWTRLVVGAGSKPFSALVWVVRNP